MFFYKEYCYFALAFEKRFFLDLYVIIKSILMFEIYCGLIFDIETR